MTSVPEWPVRGSRELGKGRSLASQPAAALGTRGASRDCHGLPRRAERQGGAWAAGRGRGQQHAALPRGRATGGSPHPCPGCRASQLRPGPASPRRLLPALRPCESGHPPGSLLPAEPGQLRGAGPGGPPVRSHCGLRSASSPAAWVTPRPTRPACCHRQSPCCWPRPGAGDTDLERGKTQEDSRCRDRCKGADRSEAKAPLPGCSPGSTLQASSLQAVLTQSPRGEQEGAGHPTCLTALPPGCP